jgi:mannose-6-phosphate isomerase
MLKYEPMESKNLELKHETWKKSSTGKTQIFYAPMDEFDLLNTKLAKEEKELVKDGINGPAVFIVTEGDVSLCQTKGEEKEEKLKQGQVVFIKPNTGFKLKATTEQAEVWGAFIEVWGEGCYEDRA